MESYCLCHHPPRHQIQRQWMLVNNFQNLSLMTLAKFLTSTSSFISTCQYSQCPSDTDVFHFMSEKMLRLSLTDWKNLISLRRSMAQLYGSALPLLCRKWWGSQTMHRHVGTQQSHQKRETHHAHSWWLDFRPKQFHGIQQARPVQWASSAWTWQSQSSGYSIHYANWYLMSRVFVVWSECSCWNIPECYCRDAVWHSRCPELVRWHHRGRLKQNMTPVFKQHRKGLKREAQSWTKENASFPFMDLPFSRHVFSAEGNQGWSEKDGLNCQLWSSEKD